MMQFVKTFASVVLIAVLLSSFVACGSAGSTADVDEEGNTVVRIMFHVDKKSAEGQAYQKRLDAFNSAYAERKIKASPIFKARTTGAAGYEQELQNAQLEGTLADIITFDAPNCASYAASGLLYDISSSVPEATQDDFYSLNLYGGRLYGLPVQESSAGFYYNKKLFEQAGIDVSAYTVDEPWTFNQFKSVCAQLKAAGITPVDMRFDATKDETGTYLLYPFIYAAGGSFTSEDGFTAKGYFDSAKSLEGFRFLKSLITEDYTSYAIGATDFFTGKVGMYLSSGWTIPDIDNKYTETFKSRDDWGILPYPKDETSASATGSWSYGITNNHHSDKKAAVELLLWMTSPDSCSAIVAATGMIAARKAAQPNYPVGSPEAVLLRQLEVSGTPRPATVSYPKFSTNFNSIIASLGGNDDLASLLSTKATDLQGDMDAIKNKLN